MRPQTSWTTGNGGASCERGATRALPQTFEQQPCIARMPKVRLACGAGLQCPSTAVPKKSGSLIATAKQILPSLAFAGPAEFSKTTVPKTSCKHAAHSMSKRRPSIYAYLAKQDQPGTPTLATSRARNLRQRGKQSDFEDSSECRRHRVTRLQWQLLHLSRRVRAAAWEWPTKDARRLTSTASISRQLCDVQGHWCKVQHHGSEANPKQHSAHTQNHPPT
mmetsp:Transcript_49597/g.159535  ORF Transcript_49597/g.159535 Transcript_49597/m.159535 type:complete len:220 (+) Transcript_49597:369-1028(+)